MKKHCIIVSLLFSLCLLAATEIPLRRAYSLEWGTLSAGFGDGNHLIVWSDTSTGDENIYAQKFAINGTAIWPELEIVADQTGPEEAQQVISASDGCCIIIWYEMPAVGNNQSIKAQKYDPQGNPLWGDGGVTVIGPVTPWVHSLATPSDNGGCHIVYRISQNTVLLQSLSSEGSPLHPAGGIQLLTYDGRIDIKDIYPDGEGGFVVNLHKQLFSGFEAHLIHVSEEGQIIGPNPILPTSPFPNVDYRLAKDPTGGWVIYEWNDFNSRFFHMQRLDLYGNLLMPEPLEYYMGTYSSLKDPLLSFYSDGRPVLSWEGLHSSGDYNEFEMVAFNSQNSPAWTAVGLSTQYILGDKSLSHHVSISPGGICRIICESTLLSLGPAGQGLPPYDGALLTSATGLIPLVIAQNEGTLLFWMEDEAYTTSLRMQVLDAGGVTQMPYGGLAIASGIRQSCTDADVCPVGDRFLTAWLDNRPELNKRLIYYQIIDEGENILSEGGVPLNPQGSYNEYFQQLLPLGEQAAIIYSIWINGGFRAYLQVIGSDGNKLYNGYGLEIFSDYTVNSGSNCYASYYDGDFYVTWSKFAGEPGNLSAELRAQRISGGSSLWGPSGKLIRQSTPLAGFYATGMQGNYVIWTEHYQTRVLKLDSQGDPYPGWDSAGILALDTSVSQRYYMQASCMESDNLILILGIQQGNTERIVAQKFDPQGQRILAPSGMSVFPDQPVTYLMDVIQSPTSLDLLYCDGSILRLQRLNPDCSIIGSPSGLPIIQYNGYGLEARLIRYNNLNYNVYICYDQSPDDNQKDIYCQEICPEDGSLVGSLVPVCTAPGLQTQMRAASQGLSAVLVWMDERARIMGSSLDTHSVYADFRYTGATSTDDPQIIPPEYVMIQTWPNPFRESLSIKLKSVPSEVEISVFNLRGQRIRSLSDFIRGEDYMIWNWDGKDDSGISCAQGIYFIRAVSKGMDLRKKVLLLN